MTVPVRIDPVFLDKVWGSTRVEPWFPPSDRKIGEVWFPCEHQIPLLLKFIFTEEALSVQVHPGDEFARKYENSAGKTEMWHILRADRGAQLALGFTEPLAPSQVKEASQTGEIERLLNWFEVQPGETYLVEAGTVHAIGAGLALCEIQQFSDITYRLYDYGRPRELHLDKAMQVSRAGVHPGAAKPVPQADGWTLLAESQYFRTEARSIDSACECRNESGGPQLLVFLDGRGRISGQPFALGEVWLLPADGEGIRIEPERKTRVLRTFVPAGVSGVPLT